MIAVFLFGVTEVVGVVALPSLVRQALQAIVPEIHTID